MGTRENRLTEAVLTSTHNLCFEQKYEQYQIIFIWKFPFWIVKFSIYLNGRVFVMCAEKTPNQIKQKEVVSQQR